MDVTERISLDLGPPPAPPVSANQTLRRHWAQNRRAMQPWRDAAFWWAKQRAIPRRVAGRRCAITLHLPFPDERRRDPHNYVMTCKAFVDGLILAGCWPDDTPEFVTVTEPVLYKGEHVWLILTTTPGRTGSTGRPSASSASPSSAP